MVLIEKDGGDGGAGCFFVVRLRMRRTTKKQRSNYTVTPG